MYTHKLFTWMVVLILTSAACQAASSVASRAEPTASPVPSPTDTAVSAQPTATQPPPPTVSPTEAPTEAPTPDAGSAPVIQSVDLRQETTGKEMTVYQDIRFQDVDGDARSLNYEIVSSTVEDLVVNNGTINSPSSEQKKGAKVTGTWNCGSGNYEVVLRIVIADKKGNKSEPSEYTIVCGLGEVKGGFPDPFDDNRNEWDLSDQYSIQDGALQFRDVQKDTSYWVSCKNCLVRPDQSSVSVEASWSNSANLSLGLLIDNKTCTPDGLVFILGPHGYYSILQAVRDASGEWSHWRRFIDWTKSSKIRRAQDQPNLLTAEYEFNGETLHVSLFINGTYTTRVEVFGYNGAQQCQPGLFSDSGLDSNFDNFSIPAIK